ncbi:transcriptional adapter 2-alpha-like isoform X2 [Sycon ciliatum]|uniref:transcriptional adapter 2-alpha-like isoform X2 n=1 Tax=Sycon ciliatum TaxID=27933 RepID=UPI0031F699D0
MDDSGQHIVPKEITISEVEAAIERTEVCSGCSAALRLPYILCQECSENIRLCTSCFSRGVEVKAHQSDHAYQLVHLNFAILEDNWTAEEELKLIKALSNSGFGNWPEIAQHVQSKDAKECEQHYLQTYVNSPLPQMPRIEPPATVGLASSSGFTNGYLRPNLSDLDVPEFMACRGDFATEHLNDAESVVSDVEFDPSDCDLSIALKLAAIDIYQNVLEQREARKRSIRDHGLINLQCHQNHERELCRHIGSVNVLRPCMRMQSAGDHEQLLQSLCYEQFLRTEIRRLQDYRTLGIRSRRGAQIYETLKQRQFDDSTGLQSNEDVSRAMEMLSACPRDLDAPLGVGGGGGGGKRLDQAEHAASLERLSPSERELCSSLRLRPHVYESYRAAVSQEMDKHGRLRLADARRLLPIDVNKTRKLYDFFVESSIIIPA